MLLVRMILEMIQVVDSDTCSLTFGMRTSYLATAL